MLYEWDEAKNRTNRSKHGISFETAVLVFDDPHALTQSDPTADHEDRLIPLGAIGPGAVLFVVLVSYENAERREVIRIVSARPATARERTSYEEAHAQSAARNRRHRENKRRRH